LPQKIIWALLDERQGNTSQTLGVAEALGAPYVTKNIRFNLFTKLPNFLLNSNTLCVSKETLAELQAPWPDITITCARRLGIVASYIKSQRPSCFTAQIQWPGAPSSHFDFIAAPAHDNAHTNKNVFTTLGAPHRVTLALLKSEAEKWRAPLAHLPTPRIALLIGGSSRGGNFGEHEAKELAKLSSTLAATHNASLLITTSRRTEPSAIKTLSDNLTVPHYLHDWQKNEDGANPYFGFLGLADAAIATGDSVSMCSEACATGKPLFVYATDAFVSGKHQRFLEKLYAEHLAKPLKQYDTGFFAPAYRLDDALLIADQIRTRAGLEN